MSTFYGPVQGGFFPLSTFYGPVHRGRKKGQFFCLQAPGRKILFWMDYAKAGNSRKARKKRLRFAPLSVTGRLREAPERGASSSPLGAVTKKVTEKARRASPLRAV